MGKIGNEFPEGSGRTPKNASPCFERRPWFKVLYMLRLPYRMIGLGGISSVRALATVLQEELRKEKVPLCHHLQELKLEGNNLNDEHLAVLAPAFGKCSILEGLHLNDNN